MSERTVLVTGGSGFLGKEIVRTFLSHQWHVRSISRHTNSDLQLMGVECFCGDLSADKAVVMQATKDCEVVIHCAAKAGVWGTRDEFYQSNVLTTKLILECCEKNNVAALVFTSSPSVVFSGKDDNGCNEALPYPKRFHSLYSETKAIAEQMVLCNKDIRCCALRPHLIWGPNEPHMLPRIWANADKLRIIGNGKNVVDCVYVTNAAEAHYLAANELLSPTSRCKGNAYFVTNNEPVVLWDFINRILEMKGMKPLSRHVPKHLAIAISTFLEQYYRMFPPKYEPYITGFVARELSSSHWYDCSAARRDFGYIPRITIEEGLRLTADAL